MPITNPQKARLKKLGARVKELRMAKGLSLNDLGFKADKEPQSISRLEMGKINPSFLYLIELCMALEIEISELFDD